MNKFVSIILSFLLALLFLSCEKEKSVTIDTALSPPLVTSSSLQDTTFNLDADSILISNGKYTIVDSIIVFVNDPNGFEDIDQVSYRIYKPSASTYFTSGTLSRVSTISVNSAIYSRKITFSMSRSEAGVFKIDVVAQGKSNLKSNTIVSSILITRNNSRPLIFNLNMPDTLIQPTHGSLPFKLFVSVNDSDGYNDTNLVFFKQLYPKETNNIQMYDDGSCCPIPLLNNRTSGDNAANDGIFTITESIDSSNSLGDHKLFFQAIDNNGALSDSLFGTFTIVAQ